MKVQKNKINRFIVDQVSAKLQRLILEDMTDKLNRSMTELQEFHKPKNEVYIEGRGAYKIVSSEVECFHDYTKRETLTLEKID